MALSANALLRLALLPGLAVGFSACAGADEAPSLADEAGVGPFDPRDGADRPWPRAEVEQDLRLVLRRSKSEPMELMRDPGFEVELHNASSERSYGIVLPSDGSESAWREPHVGYSVDALGADGSWRALIPQHMARCGLYDENWFDEAHVLLPEAGIALPWFRFIDEWELDGVERVRVKAHYAYGKHAVERRTLPPELRRTPPFELESNVLELPVESSLAVELRMLGPLSTEADQPLGTMLEVVVTNASDRRVPFVELGVGASLELEVLRSTGETSRTHVMVRSSRLPTESDIVWLEPAERRSIVPASLATDEYWDLPADVQRIRARLHVAIELPGGGFDTRLALSPWVSAR